MQECSRLRDESVQGTGRAARRAASRFHEWGAQEYARCATSSFCVLGVQTLRCRAQGRVREQRAAFTIADPFLIRHRHHASGELSEAAVATAMPRHPGRLGMCCNGQKCCIMICAAITGVLMCRSALQNSLHLRAAACRHRQWQTTRGPGGWEGGSLAVVKARG